MSCFESFNVTVSAAIYPFVPRFRLAYYWAACGSQFKNGAPLKIMRGGWVISKQKVLQADLN